MFSGSIFEGRRAAIVSFQQGNNSVQERAEREIILCAGAIGSPQLLMLSGVGPAEHLSHFNVPIACDLPELAKTSRPSCLRTAYECIKPVSLASAESFSNLMRYMISKKGR